MSPWSTLLCVGVCLFQKLSPSDKNAQAVMNDCGCWLQPLNKDAPLFVFVSALYSLARVALLRSAQLSRSFSCLFVVVFFGWGGVCSECSVHRLGRWAVRHIISFKNLISSDNFGMEGDSSPARQLHHCPFSAPVPSD